MSEFCEQIWLSFVMKIVQKRKLTKVIFDVVLDSMKLEMTSYLHLHINFEFKRKKILNMRKAETNICVPHDGSLSVRNDSSSSSTN